MKIFQPTVESVIAINRLVCAEAGNEHLVRDRGRIESALYAAFYPGVFPFQHGGVAGLAGAMAFYLTQAHAFQDGNKRTGAMTAATFMEMNGWDLRYVVNDERSDFADLILSVAASEISKGEVLDWFEAHKVKRNVGILKSPEDVYEISEEFMSEGAFKPEDEHADFI